MLLPLLPGLLAVVLAVPQAQAQGTASTTCGRAPPAPAASPSDQPSNATTPTPWSTQMIRSVISRSQGLVSSGQATSTLESGFVSLAIQAWLGLYAFPRHADDATATATATATASAFAAYVEAVLGGISGEAAFANVSGAARLPLDRLTVAQAIANLQREAVASDGDGEGADGGGACREDSTGCGRELTVGETEALSTLNASLAVQERNQYGGFWYYLYPDWSYLDGTVSFLPFMTLSSQAWGHTPSYADALLQITLLYDACYQNDTGLLAHGYDASRTAAWVADPATGASPWVWGRSLGWYLAGLVNAWEVLTTSPGNDSYAYSSSSSSSPSGTNTTSGGGKEIDDNDDNAAAAGCTGESTDCAALASTIQAQFTTLATNLLPYQDASGAWFQLPTAPGAEGNFLESSSTGLFAFAILKALRLGLLSPPTPSPPPSSSSSSGGAPLAPNMTTTTTTTTTTHDFAEAAVHAYDYLVGDAVVDYGNGTLGFNGTVTVCSLNSTANYTYYTSQPVNPDAPLGEAAFVLASLEVERLAMGRA